MVKDLYSDFDPSLTIRSTKGKTFSETDFPYPILKNREIAGYSKAIEEIVILKHEQKWSNATVYGVEKSFLLMSDMPSHLVDGETKLTEGKIPFALIGAGLLEKLQGYIHDERDDYEFLEVYFPLRESKIKIGSTPFNNEFVRVAGNFNFNKDVNHEAIVLPLDFVQNQLDYKQDITCIYVHIPNEKAMLRLQKELQKTLGENWIVKTQFEKNELIYKTSKTEKIIVVAILVFVFIIAAFNLMTALVMGILEKKKDIFTMYSFGMTKQMITKIYFYNGLMIALKGIAIGLIIGYAICFAQQTIGIIRIPNISRDIFPIQIHWKDALLITTIVLSLSVVAAYLPVKYLLNKIKNDE